MDNTALICVDAEDTALHPLDKDSCHDGEGRLHRAFSVFLFDTHGRVLLQRRAGGKRLWPGFWSNSVCSHPRWGESLAASVQRRLHEEVGAAADVEYLFDFTYRARYGEIGSEHELCHVFAGRIDPSAIRVDPDEIAETRWCAPAEIDRELAEAAQHFTPWFVLEWPRVRASAWCGSGASRHS